MGGLNGLIWTKHFVPTGAQQMPTAVTLVDFPGWPNLTERPVSQGDLDLCPLHKAEAAFDLSVG